MSSLDSPQKAIGEFIEIYKEQTGEELSWDAAKLKAENFLSLMDIITRPVNTEKQKE